MTPEFPDVDATPERSAVVEWAFWAACALAALGGISPLVLAAGQTSRITGVVYPFAVAAAAMAVAALTYRRGRYFTAIIYFFAGLAMAYGALLRFTVPLRLAVEGTCAPSSAQCPVGFEVPMTSAENIGLTTAVVLGALALFAGFFGLSVLYHRRRLSRTKQVWPESPPVAQAEAAPAEKPTPAAEPVQELPPAG
jgi:hypothetical protein